MKKSTLTKLVNKAECAIRPYLEPRSQLIFNRKGQIVEIRRNMRMCISEISNWNGDKVIKYRCYSFAEKGSRYCEVCLKRRVTSPASPPSVV